MKVLHLAPTLQVGGAERFLQRLAPALASRHGVEQRVLALRSDGPTGEALRRGGISAEALAIGGAGGLIRAARAAREIVSDWCPDVVQSWLYLADMTGAIATLGRPRTRLVWNLRCSDVWLRPGSRVIRKACAAIADRAPDAIIACGERAADYHRTLGYPAKAMTVIPNGYHFPALEETQALRARRRSERTQGPLLVGAVGRYDRAKGYGFLLRAIALLRAQGRNVQLAIAGRGCDPANTVLVEEIARHGLTGLVDARGELEDLRSFFAELDIFCLSSVSEGFPNALCEAIAEATPAVATDVGDAAHIMGPDGTVPPASAEMLAAAIARLLDMPGELREARATAAARRVRQTYSLDHIADLYYAVYRSVIDNADAALA